MLKKLLCKLGLHQIEVENVIKIVKEEKELSVTYGKIICKNCKKEISKIIVDVR